MPATVTITMNKFPELAAKLPQAVGTIVQETLFEIETTAKLRVPVDTGNLRASITPEMTSDTGGMVSTNVSYSVFQEYGTVYQAARPYMTPAGEGARSEFMRKMKNLESYLE